jgi:hypothetical protein
MISTYALDNWFQYHAPNVDLDWENGLLFFEVVAVLIILGCANAILKRL